MFDELKILITGDTAGIEKAVKGALKIVQGGVEAMNDETVDWTGIFSRAVSPAIISSVASMFAFAIAQSLEFQQAMNQTGTAAGQNTQQIAQMGQAALDLSTQVPSSAQDIANSMVQVSSIFSNTADQQQVVAAMAELAASGFGDLNDITASSVDLFKQFGVTTTSQAIDVLTSLMHAAEGAKETIPQLTQQFGTFSDQLPGADKNVDSFNGLISTFASEVQNLGAAGAQQIFSALAASSQSAVGPMELLGVSFSDIQKSLLDDGGLNALSKVSDTLLKMGPGASLIATNFGLSAQQVGQFQTNATKLPEIATDAKAIATNSQSIGDAYNQSSSALRNLDLLWNTFTADAIGVGKIFEPLVNGFAGALNTMLGDAGGFFKDLTDGLGSAFSVFFGNNLQSAAKGAFSGLANAFDDVFVKPASQAADGILSAVGVASSGQLNSSLQGTGVGFDNGTLGRLDQSASSSGLISSLISALQTGIQGGQYTTLVNTFHLSVPSGNATLTPKMIAQQLYQQFQGTK